MAKFCGNCGNKMDSDATFCTNCGTSNSGVVKSTSSSDGSYVNGFAIAGFICSFLFAFVGLIYIVLFLFLLLIDFFALLFPEFFFLFL